MSFFINKLLQRESKEDGKNIIVWPKMYSYLMIACLAGFVLMYIFILLVMIFTPEKSTEYVVISILQCSIFIIPISLFCFIFILYLAKFKIIVKNDCFVYKNLFRRTKTYSYDNIDTRIIGSSYHFYQNDKLIVKISFLMDNCDLLDKRITAFQRKHKIVHKHKSDGVIKRTKLWIILSISYFVIFAAFNYISVSFGWWWYYTLLCHIPNLLFIPSCLVWKITFKDGVLIKRSLFSWNKRYNIEELTFDENDNMWLYKVYHGKKIIAFVLEIEYDSMLIETNLNPK